MFTKLSNIFNKPGFAQVFKTHPAEKCKTSPRRFCAGGWFLYLF